MHALKNDIDKHVDQMKTYKRSVHKERLRLVEPLLEMNEREAARHRVEAGLTKFKTVEREKAHISAMYWLAKQIPEAP